MKLTEQDELKPFKLKVGLFVFPFNRATPRVYGTGVMALKDSVVVYDHFEEQRGLHVFHVLDRDGDLDGAHYVAVPEGYEEEMIEGPINESE